MIKKILNSSPFTAALIIFTTFVVLLFLFAVRESKGNKFPRRAANFQVNVSAMKDVSLGDAFWHFQRMVYNVEDVSEYDVFLSVPKETLQRNFTISGNDEAWSRLLERFAGTAEAEIIACGGGLVLISSNAGTSKNLCDSTRHLEREKVLLEKVTWTEWDELAIEDFLALVKRECDFRKIYFQVEPEISEKSGTANLNGRVTSFARILSLGGYLYGLDLKFDRAQMTLICSQDSDE